MPIQLVGRAIEGKMALYRNDRADSMHESTTHIAAAARARRKDLGLTQEDLADLAGCSARFVRALEAGKETVRLDKALAVLDALGLQVEVRRRGTS